MLHTCSIACLRVGYETATWHVVLALVVNCDRNVLMWVTKDWCEVVYLWECCVSSVVCVTLSFSGVCRVSDVCVLLNVLTSMTPRAIALEYFMRVSARLACVYEYS